MCTDERYTAVVDRIEDGLAILQLERGGEVVDSLVVEEGELPPDGRHQDAVLTVVVDDGALVDAEYRPEETTERRKKAQSRFDRLSRRPPSDESEQ
jgi:hypothetical protein